MPKTFYVKITEQEMTSAFPNYDGPTIIREIHWPFVGFAIRCENSNATRKTYYLHIEGVELEMSIFKSSSTLEKELGKLGVDIDWRMSKKILQTLARIMFESGEKTIVRGTWHVVINDSFYNVFKNQFEQVFENNVKPAVSDATAPIPDGFAIEEVAPTPKQKMTAQMMRDFARGY